MLLPVDRIYPCESVAQALDCLARDDAARPLAAGTDLVPMLRDGAVRNARFVDLHNIKELRYIRYEDGLLQIGSMTTHQEIAESEVVKKHLPALAYACSQIGAAQIRRRATIGGNICHASPAADTLPVLIAAEACAVIRMREYKKTVLLERLFTGVKKTGIPRDALLEEITVLIPEGGWRGHYYKVGGRSALTIAIASAAVLRGGEGLRVAYGSMGPVVKRVRAVEEYLDSCGSAERGRLRELAEQSLTPISDIRASREYRLEVAANLTWLGYEELSEQN